MAARRKWLINKGLEDFKTEILDDIENKYNLNMNFTIRKKFADYIRSKISDIKKASDNSNCNENCRNDAYLAMVGVMYQTFDKSFETSG